VFALAVLHAGGRVLLERRPAGGLLGGMWAFPEAELGNGDAASVATSALAAVRGLARARRLRPVGEPIALPRIGHRFTHLHATYLPFAVAVAWASASSTPESESDWVESSQPPRHALPVAQRKVLESFRSFVAGSCVGGGDATPVGEEGVTEDGGGVVTVVGERVVPNDGDELVADVRGGAP
jgi:adenine-specific DNA glycosylase